ncbi:uncharacterized protein [Hemitrygon akajei]|uniref:uncharacterized protein n=1 Tax=Hemitrygon akajei TaxID=2704970 RepID=UPI003BF97834
MSWKTCALGAGRSEVGEQPAGRRFCQPSIIGDGNSKTGTPRQQVPCFLIAGCCRRKPLYLSDPSLSVSRWRHSLLVYKTEALVNQVTEMGLCLNLFYLIVYLSMHYVEPFVKLDCVKSVIGIFNEDTELPCSMEAAGMKTLTLAKLHANGSSDNIVYKFNSNENDSGVRGRIKLHQDSQNVSLIIQKIQASDNGTYQFFVETDHGHALKSIHLIVRAPCTGPPISKKEEKGKTFLVSTTVGYPLAHLYWKTENETISCNSVDKARPGELYNTTSCIPVVDDWCSINYTCSVCIGNDGISKAPYTEPHISKKEENGKTFLVCTTVGYPLAHLYWKTENETISPNSVDNVQLDELYNITSCIPVVDDWCSINYTCSVCIGNDCISKELDCLKVEAIPPQPLAGDRTHVGVILSLVFIILLCTAAFYCRKGFFKVVYRTTDPTMHQTLKLMDWSSKRPQTYTQ